MGHSEKMNISLDFEDFVGKADVPAKTFSS